MHFYFVECVVLLLFFSEAYAIGKKEKPPFLPQNQSSSSEEEDPVPDELLCLICKDLMTDAVVIPCCGNSYCDECKYLLMSNGSKFYILPYTVVWSQVSARFYWSLKNMFAPRANNQMYLLML